MIRIMGLDVGDKTIGVAVSDPLGFTSQGITTVRRTNLKKDMKELREIIEEYGVQKVVIGLPKNMNNTLGPQGDKVVEFTEKFKARFDLEVIYQDERLSTVSAERMLINSDVRRDKRKQVIDKVAATYILQTYLDTIR